MKRIRRIIDGILNNHIFLKISITMKYRLIIILGFLCLQLSAQQDKQKSIELSVGYGLSLPYDDIDVTGSGFYLQGEYVMPLTKWIDFRPYAGLIFTKESNDDQVLAPFLATANAGMLGAKARLSAPIKWIAPYIELGLGASIGSFETLTPQTNIDKSGIQFHIPLSFGLQLGPKKNIDVGFLYYFHPGVEQIVGAAAFGISIPLKN